MQLKHDNNFMSLNYVQNLIRFYKKKIIKYFIDQIKYYNNTAFFRAKSSHVKLKAELKSFTGKSLYFFWELLLKI